MPAGEPERRARSAARSRGRGRARASRPSTGPKHSVRWNHEPRPHADTDARRPEVAASSSSAARLDEPRLARVERGQRPQRAVRRRRGSAGPSSSPGRSAGPTRSAAHGVGEPGAGTRVVVAPTPRRSPGWPRSTSVRRGRTPSGRGRAIARSRSAAAVTTMAFLPLVSASRRRAGSPVEEQRGGVVRAGEHDGVDRRVGDERATDARRRGRRRTAPRRGGRRPPTAGRRARRDAVRRSRVPA